MNYGVILVSALLSGCTGENPVLGSAMKVLIFEGADVVLPCSFTTTASGDFPTVEWSKDGLRPNVIFLYRDGCETPEMKHPAFEYRTSLIPKSLKNGNISLRISSIQLSDAGKYRCLRLWKNSLRDVTEIELIVGAVSEPNLSVVSTESGGVTLQCEVNYLLLQPEIVFLNDQGNELPAEDLETHSGNVRRRMTLQTSTNSVTCRVQQLKFNLVRNKEMIILADCTRSFLQTICHVGAAVLMSLIICGLAVWLWKRCDKSANREKLSLTRKTSDQTVSNGTFLLKENTSTANEVNNTTEPLRREVDHLKAELRVQKEINCNLQEKLKCQLSPVVCQLRHPTIPFSDSKPSLDDHHIHSPKSAKGPKDVIQGQNSNPGPGSTLQRKHRTHGSLPSVCSDAATSTSLSLSKKHLSQTSPVRRSGSLACVQSEQIQSLIPDIITLLWQTSKKTPSCQKDRAIR